MDAGRHVEVIDGKRNGRLKYCLKVAVLFCIGSPSLVRLICGQFRETRVVNIYISVQILHIPYLDIISSTTVKIIHFSK